MFKKWNAWIADAVPDEVLATTPTPGKAPLAELEDIAVKESTKDKKKPEV